MSARFGMLLHAVVVAIAATELCCWSAASTQAYCGHWWRLQLAGHVQHQADEKYFPQP